MKQPDHNNTAAASRWPVVAAAALLAGLALLLVSLLGFAETRATMTGVRVAEAAAAARAVRADLDRAIGYGAPLAELPGVEAYLAARVERLPELRFFAVIGPDGRRLYQAGIDAAELDQLLARLPPPAAALADAALPVRQDIGAFALARAGLRDGGAVLAAVEPAAIAAALTRDIGAAWPFFAGCILLVVGWTAAAARGGVVEPAARLAAAMRAATDGRFDLLLVRRARDPVGACLLAFNAVVAGLHVRRGAALAQADDVRHAVFDQDVAAAATAARDAVAADLGDGLATAPARFSDPRASDADVFAATLAAAGVMGVADALETAIAPPTVTIAVTLAALLIGWGLGVRIGWRRLLVAPLTAALLLAAGLVSIQTVLAGPAVLLLAGLAGGGLGAAVGVAARQRRAARLGGGIGGGGWVVPAGGLAGTAMAWGVAGDPLTTGLGAALLAVIAFGAALAAPGRRE